MTHLYIRPYIAEITDVEDGFDWRDGVKHRVDRVVRGARDAHVTKDGERVGGGGGGSRDGGDWCRKRRERLPKPVMMMRHRNASTSRQHKVAEAALATDSRGH